MGLHPRLHLANIVAAIFPPATANSARAGVFRGAGFKVGEGTIIRGQPHINGNGNLYERLSIGRNCTIELGCTLDLEGEITIGDRVTIGHEVMLLTSSHEIGSREFRAGAVVRSPIVIEDGAWIGPRSIVLPGITIGAGSVVAPGSLVNKDIAPNTRVAGAPAKVVEQLSETGAA